MRVRTRKGIEWGFLKERERKEVKIRLSSGKVYRLREADGGLDVNADHQIAIRPKAGNAVEIQ